MQKHDTVMFLEIDYFKSINNNAGHYAGDIGREIKTTLLTSIGISIRNVNDENNNHLHVIEETIKETNTAVTHAKKVHGNSYVFNTRAQNKKKKRYY